MWSKRIILAIGLIFLFSAGAFAEFKSDLVSGDSGLHHRDFKAAENYYTKAAALAKTDMQVNAVRSRLVMLYLQQKDLVKAKSKYTEIITEKTASGFYTSSAYFYLGCIAGKEGDTTSAKTNFEAALATDGISDFYAEIITTKKLSAEKVEKVITK